MRVPQDGTRTAAPYLATATSGGIKARPTTYKGIAMRSRLEATYAARFDELGLAWSYEPMCFAGPDGQYLPDFALTDVEIGRAFVDGWLDPFMPASAKTVYVEVKPPGHSFVEVTERMQIVWESEPAAALLLVSESYGAGGPSRSDGVVAVPIGSGDTMWLQAWLRTRQACGHPYLAVGLWTYYRQTGTRFLRRCLGCRGVR